MEDKLISSQWLINDLLNKSFYPAIVKSSIESAPAVDAVETVRCKDCKHFMEYTKEYKRCVEGADGDCRRGFWMKEIE